MVRGYGEKVVLKALMRGSFRKPGKETEIFHDEGNAWDKNEGKVTKLGSH